MKLKFSVTPPPFLPSLFSTRPYHSGKWHRLWPSVSSNICLPGISVRYRYSARVTSIFWIRSTRPVNRFDFPPATCPLDSFPADPPDLWIPVYLVDPGILFSVQLVSSRSSTSFIDYHTFARLTHRWPFEFDNRNHATSTRRLTFKGAEMCQRQGE
jgi:hypothetical protein